MFVSIDVKTEKEYKYIKKNITTGLKMGRIVYGLIWDLSEYFKIPLGRFAPYVFHQMMGGDKVKKRSNKKGQQ